MVRAAQGETKSKNACWPGAPLMFPDTFFSISPSIMFTPAFKCSMLLGCLFPYHPSKTTLFSFPTSCFSHHTDYLWTSYIFHLLTQCTCLASHWKVRFLKVRTFVSSVHLSPATGIVLAKGMVRRQQESLGADGN